jgi:FkbM family methyltransferase
MKVVKVKSVQFEVRNPKDHIQKHWLAGNFYEASSNGMLAYMKRKGYTGRCLDIGASVGNHTVYFEKMLGCDVTSFEPSLESFEHLKANCELNDCNAKLHYVALGAKKGRATMQSMSDVNVGMRQVKEGDDVDIARLDTLVDGQFDFIKIDVEHYNIPLLKGANKTLKAQKKCHVFIECETPQILHDTNMVMRSYGYTRQDVKLNHTPTYLWTL